MKASEYPHYQAPFYEYNQAQSLAVPLLDKDVNLIISFPTATGKCMVGETRVLLSDGSYRSMESLFRDGEFHNVLSLNGATLKMDIARARILRRRHVGEMITILTDGGDKVCVTPEHCFLVKRTSRMEWIRASDMKLGDFLVVPREIRIGDNDNKIPDLLGLLGSLVTGYIDQSEIVRKMADMICVRKYGGNKILAERLGVSKRSIERWKYRSMPIPDFVKMVNVSGVDLSEMPRIKIVSNRKVCFDLPLVYGKDWSRFVGMMISDGRVKGGRIEFFNYDHKIRMEFMRCMMSCFSNSGMEFSSKRVGHVVGVRFSCRTFVELMKYWGFPDGKKSGTIRIPTVVFQSSREVIGEIIGGMVDCDGSVGENSLEYYTDSKGLAFDFKSLLLRIGVISIIRKKTFGGKVRYRVIAYGGRNAKRLLSFVRLCSDDKMSNLRRLAGRDRGHENRNVVPFVAEDIRTVKKDSGLRICDLSPAIDGVLYSRRNPSFKTLGDFLSKARKKSPAFKRLKTICDSDICFDRVETLRRRKRFNGWVFDMVAPKNRNFIAENIVAHNTILAEGAFAFHLQQNDRCRVAYVCPFRSLAAEKYESWQKEDQLSKFGIVLGTSDSDSGMEDHKKARLAIATLESFDSKTRSDMWDSYLKTMALVCFDEAHLIGDAGRGGALESAVMRFTKLNPSARIMFLSATMSNAMELAKWVKKLNGKETKLVTSSWRPTTIDKTVLSVDNNEEKEREAIRIAMEHGGMKTIIFVHSKMIGASLVKKLRNMGVRSAFHNASLPAGKRRKIEDAFNRKDSGLNILVSTSTLGAGVNVGL